MKEISLQEYLEDFKFRCSEIVVRNGDLETVKKAILQKECPFIEIGFEKDMEFRRMRRYYRKAIHNGLKDDLLKVIAEAEK